MFFEEEGRRGFKSMYGVTDDWNRKSVVIILSFRLENVQFYKIINYE